MSLFSGVIGLAPGSQQEVPIKAQIEQSIDNLKEAHLNSSNSMFSIYLSRDPNSESKIIFGGFFMVSIKSNPVKSGI